MAMLKPPSLSKPFLSLFFLLLRKLAVGRRHHHRGRMAATKPIPPPPPLPGLLDRLHGWTLVVDVDAWILRPPVRAFPYFMLVAVEAGGFLRGLLLLLMHPALCLLALLGLDDLRLKAMAMVTLFGLREKEVARISKAVLPKFFLEDVAMEGLEAFHDKKATVAVTSVFPRVMVKGFLEEYLGVDAVVGREVAAVAGRYVGFLKEEHAGMERVGALLKEMEGTRSDGDGAVGLVGAAGTVHHVVSRYCKEIGRAHV